MIRVVLDSNIYISAFNFGGPPEEVIRLAEEGAFELFTSSFILNEVRRVLTTKFSWTVADTTAVEEILQLGKTVRPRERLKIVRDPDDNRILECALSSKAHYLITGDNDLLGIGRFRTTRIVTPSAFLESSPWMKG